MSTDRVILGLLGKHLNRKELLTTWNAYFKQNNITGGLHQYPTLATELPLRLSEMFTLERMAYFLSDALAADVAPLLDSTLSAQPNVIVNNQGLLYGIRVKNLLDVKSVSAKISLQTEL